MYEKGGQLFLIMEFKEGAQLSDLWESMPENEKLALIGQLKAVFNEIRNNPSPETFSSVYVPGIWFLLEARYTFTPRTCIVAEQMTTRPPRTCKRLTWTIPDHGSSF